MMLLLLLLRMIEAALVMESQPLSNNTFLADPDPHQFPNRMRLINAEAGH